jgi:hypothetical protein
VRLNALGRHGESTSEMLRRFGIGLGSRFRYRCGLLCDWQEGRVTELDVDVECAMQQGGRGCVRVQWLGLNAYESINNLTGTFEGCLEGPLVGIAERGKLIRCEIRWSKGQSAYYYQERVGRGWERGHENRSRAKLLREVVAELKQRVEDGEYGFSLWITNNLDDFVDERSFGHDPRD